MGTDERGGNSDASSVQASVAVGFLLRGADANWLNSAHRFLASYRAHPAGHLHEPHVMLKGFSDEVALADIAEHFREEGFAVRHLDDDGFDIMAYTRWARELPSDYICVLNSHSEILADNWLSKFMRNLVRNGIAMASATASFESLGNIWPEFPRFPNVHLRSNAFCIRRELFIQAAGDARIKNKFDAFFFESGPKSITAKLLAAGKRVAVVGRDGRAYGPRYWPFSGTFRQGTQSNLLVADNVTRTYDEADLSEKVRLAGMTWGPYLNEDYPLPDRTK
ncbi:hypothetical protein [Bradyrhizobium sp.]|uniref:hypothetical protein n=1 Tax=Bradyrhizobium sp. TaxID=376 RepID=UPI001EC906EC|nr:hypothetical protein [Bradyrhizobium sp.]MBV9983673.1 hypothetical protein [Bradyrhizobium sp.]